MARIKPTVISLFSGCGGSSLGYKMAGYKELLAIDFWDKAIKAFKMNFPKTPAWCEDINKVKAARILNECGLKKGELDLLDASPPCQGFSPAGKCRVNDERNDLFLEFVRLVQGLKPKVFVMENVPGLVRGKMKGKFLEIMAEFKRLPYKVKCRIMNAANYGVPQSRRRLIWIGIQDALKIEPVFPKPNNGAIPAWKALEGLPEDDSMTLNKLGLAIWMQCKPGESFGKYHPKGHWFNAKKLDPLKPAMTIEKMVMAMGAAGTFHWRFPRALNIAEVKRLFTYPDEFVFEGKFESQWALMGNSVPPKMIQAIAVTIRKEILHA